MYMAHRLLLLAQGAVVAIAAALSSAASAAYPDKPIRLIVPYAPGGTTDVLGRALAEQLRKELGQPVIVDNKPGGNTGIGAQALAASPPDGYTLLLATAATVVLNPLLNTRLAYDPAQLVPVARVAVTPLVIVARADTPMRSLADLVAKAKAQPGQLNYGSTGVGSSLHLAGELLQIETGTQMVHVPYKGSAPALTGLLSGETHVLFDAVGSSMPLIEGGKLKPLAVTSAQRLPILANVPTVAESGVPHYDVSTWFGIMVPRNTPEEIVARLNAVLAGAVRDKGFRAQFEALGMIIPEPMKPTDFRAYIAADSVKWGAVIKARKITVD
jgi:tripartite-type tricarboxylate transporter receptor subunit TctC